MEFDMEMEELELLEESYRFNEEEEQFLDFQPPEPYPYESDGEKPSEAPPTVVSAESPPFPEIPINDHKRLRPSDGPDASVEKRGRISEDNDNSEWLRYSPSKAAEERGDGDSVDAPTIAEPIEKKEDKCVWRFASEIDGEFLPVTAPSGGDRVYAKVSRVREAEDRRGKYDARSLSEGLIAEPFGVLMQKAEQETFAKALQASSEDQSDVLNETPVVHVHEQLWVDKYSPNSFTELLSDEQTNREVLLWLKQWDSTVFGSEVRSTSDEVLSALKRHSSSSQNKKFSNSNYLRRDKGSKWNKENYRHSNDSGHKPVNVDSNLIGVQDLLNKKSRSIGPPEQKILLLCGPPGLGKTTLAHVAARHCGYRVVEINASDDRSASTIEAKILDVVQMNSVSADSRPKCLVIDEIDGSLGEGKGAVDVILKMVSADKKSDMGKDSVNKDGNPQKTAGKKGRKSEHLSRPVICICNDLYAPVLRPLRQIAEVHVFVQPTVSRVVSRIKNICNKEGMKTSSIGLTALAEYTECDIRSCLNTLQFLHSKKENLNVLEVGSQVVGRKDMSKSVFDIWKEVFQKRKSKRERSGISSHAVSSDFDSLHSLISSRGDYDLIMDGVHENILQLQYHDPLMQKSVTCLDCLSNSDLLYQHTWRTQQMHLLGYQPAIAISIHRLVAQLQRPNIEWPKSYQRYRATLIERKDSLRSWYHKTPPHISRHLSATSFVEETVSPFLHILSPPTLRPVAFNSLSEKEKTEMEELVMKMVSYSITYKNAKPNFLPREPSYEVTADILALSFDPPIADFVNFKGYRSGHFVLALAMKQVLLHEVEKQRILQVSVGRSGYLADGFNKGFIGDKTGTQQLRKADNGGKNTGHANSITSASSSKPDSGPNSCKISTVKPKPIGGAKRTSTSFFDRFRKLGKGSQNPDDSGPPKAETSERDLRPVLFKFNEGFTNAVKRPVRMREFLI